MKKNILLINFGKRTSDNPYAAPPLGIMSLAAYIRQNLSCNIRIINQRQENCTMEQMLKTAVSFHPDIVGIHLMTPSLKGLKWFTKTLKYCLPKTPVILGGPHVTLYQEKVLSGNHADAAVSGEGEIAFEMICASSDAAGSLQDVPGIFLRSDKGEILRNPGNTPVIADPDNLPFLAYDLIDLPKYWKIQSMPPIPYRKYASLFSSRGCPNECTYCLRVFGHSFRQQSVARVISEIKYLITGFGVKEIEFLDDVFNLHHKWIEEFCEEVRRQNIRVRLSFPNGLRTDILTKEEIENLVDAGMGYAGFALESGSPRIQKMIRKNLNIPKFLENLEHAVSLGVFSYGFMMIGFPTETVEEIEETIRVACGSMLHGANFNTVNPFPNTELYEQVAKDHPEKLAKIHYTGFRTMNTNLTDLPDAVITRLRKKANRKFYLDGRRALRVLRDYPDLKKLPLCLPELIRRIGP